MEFRVLGPLRATDGDRRVDIGTPAERRMVAVLLTDANAPFGDDRLVDELWGERPPRTALHLVHVYASRLRVLLPPAPDGSARIERDGGGYLMRLGPGELDADRFVAAMDEGGRTSAMDPRTAHGLLSSGLQLWTGPPFADLIDPPQSVARFRDHLERLRREGVGTWADLGLQLGLHRSLVPVLSRMVDENPYDEELHAQLMLALYRSGRQADALRLARNLQARLAEELGVEPGAAIRDLYRDILLQDPRLLPVEPEPPSNLPRPAASFVGREQELRDLAVLLAESRLVTLTGPGGVGKTRLAIELAHTEPSRFAGGVWWIDLAQLDDPRRVAREVANALGLRRAPDAELIVTLTRALYRRRVLLVLDNCEHLANAVAELAATLLHETVATSVVATSRRPLHVSGERVFVVPPLALPRGDEPPDFTADATRLFVERARAVDASFRVDAHNASAVVELCRRLDGLPLAIEMAAARVRVLSVTEIAGQLAGQLELLELGHSDTPERHRTIQAAIDVSYSLLADPERDAFERMSVMVAAFDLDAAGAVGMPGASRSRVIRMVAALVDASMLACERQRDETRYRMLEILRAYGAARLAAHGTEPEARAAHARYFLGLAAEASAAVGTAGFSAWMPRLEEAYAEVRQALTWSLANEAPAQALTTAPALAEFWFRRGDALEAAQWSARLLAAETTGITPLFASAVHHAASFAADLTNDLVAARTEAEAAVGLARDAGNGPMQAITLWARSTVAFAQGDVSTMVTSAQEALAVAKGLEDPTAVARPLSALAYAAMLTGDLSRAAALFDEAIPLLRQQGDRASLVIMGLCPRTGVAIGQADMPLAERCASEAIEASRGTGWEAAALAAYFDVLFEVGDLHAAEMFAAAGAKGALETGLEIWFRMGVRNLAACASLRGRHEEAAVLLGGATRNLPAFGFDPKVYRPTEARCRSEIGDVSFERLAAEGRSLGHLELMALVAHRSDGRRPEGEDRQHGVPVSR